MNPYLAMNIARIVTGARAFYVDMKIGILLPMKETEVCEMLNHRSEEESEQEADEKERERDRRVQALRESAKKGVDLTSTAAAEDDDKDVVYSSTNIIPTADDMSFFYQDDTGLNEHHLYLLNDYVRVIGGPSTNLVGRIGRIIKLTEDRAEVSVEGTASSKTVFLKFYQVIVLFLLV